MVVNSTAWYRGIYGCTRYSDTRIMAYISMYSESLATTKGLIGEESGFY